MIFSYVFVFFFKQKTAYEMRISDWSSDVCSSDLPCGRRGQVGKAALGERLCQWGPTQRPCTVRNPYRRRRGQSAARRRSSSSISDRIARRVARLFGDEGESQQFGDIGGAGAAHDVGAVNLDRPDRKSTRLNSSP